MIFSADYSPLDPTVLHILAFYPVFNLAKDFRLKTIESDEITAILGGLELEWPAASGNTGTYDVVMSPSTNGVMTSGAGGAMMRLRSAGISAAYTSLGKALGESGTTVNTTADVLYLPGAGGRCTAAGVCSSIPELSCTTDLDCRVYGGAIMSEDTVGQTWFAINSRSFGAIPYSLPSLGYIVSDWSYAVLFPSPYFYSPSNPAHGCGGIGDIFNGSARPVQQPTTGDIWIAAHCRRQVFRFHKV